MADDSARLNLATASVCPFFRRPPRVPRCPLSGPWDGSGTWGRVRTAPQGVARWACEPSSMVCPTSGAADPLEDDAAERYRHHSDMQSTAFSHTGRNNRSPLTIIDEPLTRLAHRKHERFVCTFPAMTTGQTFIAEHLGCLHSCARHATHNHGCDVAVASRRVESSDINPEFTVHSFIELHDPPRTSAQHDERIIVLMRPQENPSGDGPLSRDASHRGMAVQRGLREQVRAQVAATR